MKVLNCQQITWRNQFLKRDNVEEVSFWLTTMNECARISGVRHVRFAHARILFSGVGEWTRVYLKDSENLNVWAASGPHCQPYPDWVKFRFSLCEKIWKKKARSIWLFLVFYCLFNLPNFIFLITFGKKFLFILYLWNKFGDTQFFS